MLLTKCMRIWRMAMRMAMLMKRLELEWHQMHSNNRACHNGCISIINKLSGQILWLFGWADWSNS